MCFIAFDSIQYLRAFLKTQHWFPNQAYHLFMKKDDLERKVGNIYGEQVYK